MAKFGFKLQPLLNVKLQQEDNMKNELGKAVRNLEHEKSKLKNLENEKEDHISEFNRMRKTTVEKLIGSNRYISLLSARISQQKENVNCASRNVDKVREALIEIIKERKILEKLKDKKYEAYLQEQKKEEQRLNDEITGFKQMNKDTGE